MIEIKQIALDNPNQRKYNSPYGEFTMEPMSSRSYRVERDVDGQFITGLSEEQETRLGKIIGKDLTKSSDYWTTDFRMRFDLSRGSMTLDSKDPAVEIFLSAAKANNYLADSKDDLLDDILLRKRTIFYINNKEEEKKKKVDLLELNDEIGSLLYKSKNNQDRLFWITQKIGEYSTKEYKSDSLYRIISSYRERLKKLEDLENFKSVLELSNVELQAGYFVKLASSKGILTIDQETRKFKYLDSIVGKTLTEATKFFSEKKNEAILGALINEINE